MPQTIKFFYSPYELRFLTDSKAPRQGALLKIEFDQRLVGYADCHPWPELGDEPLYTQLEALKKHSQEPIAIGFPTPLIASSIAFAFLDAQARDRGLSLLASLQIPRSHYLISHLDQRTTISGLQLIDQGFTHVKIKVGKQPSQEGGLLVDLFQGLPLQLRLDFNERLTPSAFHVFCQAIEILKPQIDFIEDPFPFEPQEWAAIQAKGWTLACDRRMQQAYQFPDSAAVLIIKPANLPAEAWKGWKKESTQRKIVTTYMGHPLEQLSAAYTAACLDPKGADAHGLLSHYVYQLNDFSKQLAQQGPCFIVPSGKGFGFDDELSQIDWIALS